MNWLMENPVYFWLVLSGIFMIVEGVTYALVTIWFVGGALVAMLLSLLGLSFVAQVIAFVAVSLVLLVITRPLVKRRPDAITPTNVNAVVGKVGIVTKEASEFFTGQGKVEGQIWTIQPLDGQHLLVDTQFIVEEVEGVRLLVVPFKEE